MSKIKVLIEPKIIKRPPEKPEEKKDTDKELDKTFPKSNSEQRKSNNE